MFFWESFDDVLFCFYSNIKSLCFQQICRSLDSVVCLQLSPNVRRIKCQCLEEVGAQLEPAVGLDELSFFFGLDGIIDGIILRHTDMTCDLDLLNILETINIFQFVIPRSLSS